MQDFGLILKNQAGICKKYTEETDTNSTISNKFTKQ